MRGLRLAPGTQGAVYVEFLVAFLPLFTFFECVLQLAAIHVAQLVTQHAAHCGARAAAVVLYDDPALYGGVATGVVDGGRQRDIERAAEMPLQAMGGIVGTDVTLSVPGVSTPRRSFGPGEAIRVRVAARYDCSFPLVARIVCSAATGRTTLESYATLPVHGARYAYD